MMLNCHLRNPDDILPKPLAKPMRFRDVKRKNSVLEGKAESLEVAPVRDSRVS